MTQQSPRSGAQPYLFLLAQPSPTARREAAKRLRELGLRVVAQYGAVAVEVLAQPAEAEAARDLGLFSLALSGGMQEEHLARLTEEQQQVVRQWNTRFTAGYRELIRDKSRRGQSWGGADVDAPAPYSQIEPEEFLPLVEEYERRTGRSAWQEAAPPAAPGADADAATQQYQPPAPAGPMTGDEFTAYERELERRLGDPTQAYHLSRLAWRLGPRYYARILDLDREFLAEVWRHFFLPEDSCWKMGGEIAVGIVFVESANAGGPRFGNSERSEIHQKIIDGLNWLAAEEPAGDLSWVYDLQFARIDQSDGNKDDCEGGVSSALEAHWRDPAMARVRYNGTSYPGEWASIAKYREDMRLANRAAHAIVIFVTPYTNCWFAYAGGGRVVLARDDDWSNWGRGALDRISAHEVSHLFGSADEYTGSGTPCSTCDSLHGCDHIPNGNCGSCARPQQDCMMEGSHHAICAYTRGQIGWAPLFVELTTADELWAGTDDDVWLDIGHRTFVLDTPDHDDRERNNREGYALWAPELQRSDIERIMIRKSEDGFAGGWELGGIRVWFQGELICDEPAINKWLEDDDRTWIGCIFDSDLVNTLEVRITTADVLWAGTDDDVSLTIASRTWNLDNSWHDDFERGNTDSFHLDPGSGLRIGDIHGARISKSRDGIAGGWKLQGIEIIANGTTVYNNQSINQWLEDDHRTWQGIF